MLFTCIRLAIPGAIYGPSFYSFRPALCAATASVCLSACLCSFFSVTCVTVHRYFYVCHNERCARVCTRMRCIIVCMTSWALAVVLELPNFLGWGGHAFDEKTHTCAWNRMASYSYSLFITVGLIGTSLLTMTVAYICIFRMIRKSVLTITPMTTGTLSNATAPNGGSPPVQPIHKTTFRLSRSLFVVYVAFCVCWTPYAVVLASDFTNVYPFELHLWSTWLAHFHSSVNCVIYLLTSSKFRQCITDTCKRMKNKLDKMICVKTKTNNAI